MKLYIVAFVWTNTHELYKEYKVFADNEQEAIDYVVRKKELESMLNRTYRKDYMVEVRHTGPYCDELK